MTNKDKPVVEVNLAGLPPDFAEVVKRAYQKKPNPKDIILLQKWIEDTPGFWRIFFDFSLHNQRNTIAKIAADKITQASITANIQEIKQKLGYTESAELEKLLIENIISTWLRFQWTDYQLSAFMGKDSVRFVELEFWERRLSMCQSRYLRACEMLARVRRLLAPRPAVQINLAAENGQQVNIAGDLHIEKK